MNRLTLEELARLCELVEEARAGEEKAIDKARSKGHMDMVTWLGRIMKADEILIEKLMDMMINQ